MQRRGNRMCKVQKLTLILQARNSRFSRGSIVVRIKGQGKSCIA